MDLLERLRKTLPIPKLESFDRILVVQPHPDDADIAIGALIAKLTDEGKDVIYLTVTDGSLGTRDPKLSREYLKKVRRKEQERAAEILGVRELIWLDFQDGGDYTEHEAMLEIARVIREVKPQTVLTVDPFLKYEVHPDHRKVGMAASAAALLHQFPLLEIPGNAEKFVEAVGYFFTSKPNELFCVEDYLQKKLEAISKHESQFTKESLQLLEMYLREKGRWLAKDMGCGYAEGIRMMRTTMLHAFPEAEIL